VVVRPERVRIDRAAATPDNAGENNVAGMLTEVIYLGNARRCHVRLASGQEIIVTQHAGERLTIQRGEAVRLFWDAEDALALRGD
jgi:ABC-type Fe3+/spermidine/putrescine transport system ATPase subunit